MKVSQETGSEANIGFGCAMMPSYLGMHPQRAAFLSFRMQPWCVLIWRVVIAVLMRGRGR